MLHECIIVQINEHLSDAAVHVFILTLLNSSEISVLLVVTRPQDQVALAAAAALHEVKICHIANCFCHSRRLQSPSLTENQ